MGARSSFGERQGSDGFPLTAHWDGRAWKLVDGPKPGPSSGLSAVSAVSSTSVWASGTEDFGNLVEHWDGKSWTISQIPSPGDANELNAAIAFPSGSVFVAGTTLHTNGLEPQVFHTTRGK